MMKKYNLIMVDDATPILNLSKKYFEEHYNVYTFDNASDCFDGLSSGMVIPDIIISDLTMPRMSGEEFVVKLKNDIRFKDIPLIVLSANDDSATKIKLLRLGVDDFIVKPFNFEELSLRIQNLFRRMALVK
jgi:two-component system, chemotaxis family, chemotaxis protein CheY